jgi:hypothetical protein
MVPVLVHAKTGFPHSHFPCILNTPVPMLILTPTTVTTLFHVRELAAHLLRYRITQLRYLLSRLKMIGGIGSAPQCNSRADRAAGHEN